jgi:hypothetical protein
MNIPRVVAWCTTLYCIGIFIILGIFGKEALDSDNYDIDHKNGKMIFSVCIISIVATIFYLRIYLPRSDDNKKLFERPISTFEIVTWVIIIIFCLGILILSFIVFSNNCRFESVYPCNHFSTPVYFFVLVPVYLIFFTIFSAIIAFGTWYFDMFCCKFVGSPYFINGQNPIV